MGDHLGTPPKTQSQFPSIKKVKQSWERLVLGWVTSWEPPQKKSQFSSIKEVKQSWKKLVLGWVTAWDPRNVISLGTLPVRNKKVVYQRPKVTSKLFSNQYHEKNSKKNPHPDCWPSWGEKKQDAKEEDRGRVPEKCVVWKIYTYSMYIRYICKNVI